MQNHNHLTRLIQANKYTDSFNYNLAVDWAIGLLQEGKETHNILMLASFGAPIDAYEIRPYITAVLKDLGLDEINGDEAKIAIIRYYITEISLTHSIRNNLGTLYHLCFEYDSEFGLFPFYLLYYSWQDLEAKELNHYYEDATLDNIESLLIKEAKIWIANY